MCTMAAHPVSLIPSLVSSHSRCDIICGVYQLHDGNVEMCLGDARCEISISHGICALVMWCQCPYANLNKVNNVAVANTRGNPTAATIPHIPHTGTSMRSHLSKPQQQNISIHEQIRQRTSPQPRKPCYTFTSGVMARPRGVAACCCMCLFLSLPHLCATLAPRAGSGDPREGDVYA